MALRVARLVGAKQRPARKTDALPHAAESTSASCAALPWKRRRPAMIGARRRGHRLATELFDLCGALTARCQNDLGDVERRDEELRAREATDAPLEDARDHHHDATNAV